MSSSQDAPPPQDNLARGKIVVVASPKGGVGKSTVATNLAVLLAAQAPLQTVLVDLDVQFGDAAALLDLVSDHTISDAASVGLNDTLLLKTFLVPHPSGLLVLAGVESPMAGGRISDEHAAAVLEMLAAEFAFIVVDTASGLADHALAALEVAADLVLVTNMSVSSIRALRKECDLLDALGLSATRHIVLNFNDRRSGLTVKDAEGVIGSPIDVVLPRIDEAPLAGNVGVPIVLQKKSGPVGKGLKELASRIQPVAPAASVASPKPAAGRRRNKRAKSQEEAKA